MVAHKLTSEQYGPGRLGAPGQGVEAVDTAAIAIGLLASDGEAQVALPAT